MQIADLMTRHVTVVAPDARIPEIAREMRDSDLGAIPVAENDRLIGMVTDRDIVVRALPDGRDPSGVTARDVMTGGALYCFADQTAEDVLQNMSEVHVRRLPVVNRDKKLVGIVSLGDLAEEAPPAETGEALKGIARAAAS
jgi:CBS domain-containing protein